MRAFGRYLDGHEGPIPLESKPGLGDRSSSTDPRNPARRLAMVRGLLRHLHVLDGATDVPAPGLLGSTGHRSPPHVYSDAEIADLLDAAGGLDPAGGLRPICYATLFGLLACTGLRISEALALSCADVDLDGGVITVRAGKRGLTRLVPLHASAVTALNAYACERAPHGHPGEAAFFRTDWSERIGYNTAHHAFSVVRRRLGWTAIGRTRVPRVHDLRHRMVVRRIQAWHAEGADVDAKIAVLATYLGHVEVRDVYWYLSAVPELMDIVGKRFEAFSQRPTSRRAVRAPQIAFDQLVQDFFLRRLINQRGASPRTVESYRDAFELLFGYIEQHLGKQPSALTLADLDAPVIVDFLEHLETMRHNTPALATLASLPSTPSCDTPPCATRRPCRSPHASSPFRPSASIGPCWATSLKSRSPPSSPRPTGPPGPANATPCCSPSPTTPAPASQLTDLKVRDVLVDRQAAVHLHGKGRKNESSRFGPTRPPNSAPGSPGPRRTRSPRVPQPQRHRSHDQEYATGSTGPSQRRTCTSLEGQHVSPHTIRHSTAVHLLQAGVDLAVIALWLGHSSPAVTHQYLEADLATKEAVLRRLTDPSPTPPRFQPGDQLLTFLQSL